MICDFWEVLSGSDSLGAVTLDFDGRVIHCNPAFSRIVARDLSELVGTDIVDITAQQHRHASREKVRAMKLGERDRMYHVLQYVRPNGVPVWCQVETLVFILPETQERQCILSFVWQTSDSCSPPSTGGDMEIHLKMMQELITITHQLHRSTQSKPAEVQINMTGADYKQVADHGGRNTLQTNNSTLLIVIFICLALVACTAIAFYAGGRFQANYWGAGVTVAPADATPATRGD